jgi:hypothetical protein
MVGSHPEAVRELLTALESLLAEAQRAGAVRPDVTVAALRALLIGTSRIAEHAGADTGLRDRTLAVIFDGLRPRPGT